MLIPYLDNRVYRMAASIEMADDPGRVVLAAVDACAGRCALAAQQFDVDFGERRCDAPFKKSSQKVRDHGGQPAAPRISEASDAVALMSRRADESE